MAIDFSKDHRVTIGGHDYPLYGFVTHPSKPRPTIPPAGIAPEVEAAMGAEAAKGPIDCSGTVEFSCDCSLSAGETYDYTPPGGATEKIKILFKEGQKYRAVFY